jgi:hypothetical protein
MRDPLPDPNKFVKDIPPQVGHILYKALARNPEDRYDNIGQFADNLEGLVNGSVKTSSRSRLLPSGGSATILIAAALLIGYFNGLNNGPDQVNPLLSTAVLSENFEQLASPTLESTHIPTQTISPTIPMCQTQQKLSCPKTQFTWAIWIQFLSRRIWQLFGRQTNFRFTFR